jgi:hypothetical protein
MLNSIEKTGTVNYSDLDVNMQDNQSLKALYVFLRGAGFTSDVL